eukprot:5150-Eustigmatos_ZCMA.PRE.1
MLLRQHSFEATQPPLFRHPDPMRRDTYVLAEHYELHEPDMARFPQLLVDPSEMLHVYQYIARTVG